MPHAVWLFDNVNVNESCIPHNRTICFNWAAKETEYCLCSTSRMNFIHILKWSRPFENMSCFFFGEFMNLNLMYKRRAPCIDAIEGTFMGMEDGKDVRDQKKSQINKYWAQSIRLLQIGCNILEWWNFPIYVCT